MAFMRIQCFGKCTGISFVDSTMILVCHNMRRNFNKVFDGLAKNGKGTMGGVITLMPTHYKLQLQSYLMQYGDVF